jgi:hypothetical protein
VGVARAPSLISPYIQKTPKYRVIGGKIGLGLINTLGSIRVLERYLELPLLGLYITEVFLGLKACIIVRMLCALACSSALFTMFISIRL